MQRTQHQLNLRRRMHRPRESPLERHQQPLERPTLLLQLLLTGAMLCSWRLLFLHGVTASGGQGWQVEGPGPWRDVESRQCLMWRG